ncbi:MAG: sulfotransferase [Candidatus Jettenia sp.]|nr:MAG: sulfotransferase [Candidatus Jettenia sp.]
MIAQLDPIYIKIRPAKVIKRLIGYALFEGRPLTTKGRWINTLIFSLFSVEKKLPQLKKVEKPIFILGTGRSGTTILGKVLSMHKDIGFLNEPKALWHFIYQDEDLIGSYAHARNAYYRLDAKQVTEEIKRTAYRLYGTYLAVTCSKRVVDKYPELIFRVPFVKAIFPDAKFLFLVRNGWDTCKSIEVWSKELGMCVSGEVHDWWGINNRKWNLLVDQIISRDEDLKAIMNDVRKFDNHRDMAAAEWIVTMKEGLKFIENFPKDILMVKYEDLVTNPEEVLSTIAEFCELSVDIKFLEYGKKILFPTPPKKHFTIHPSLYLSFEKTMNLLGYTT